MNEETDLIEITVRNHMVAAMDCPVFMEFPEPEEPGGEIPEYFIVIDKSEGSREEHIDGAMFLVQSYAPRKLEAMMLNEKAKNAMLRLEELPRIVECSLNSDYPFPDERKKQPRYQAVFDITYY